jgi:hypothetical protein
MVHQAAASGFGGLSLDKTAQEQKEKIARMRELTNADETTARFWLESFQWDLERVRGGIVCLSVWMDGWMDGWMGEDGARRPHTHTHTHTSTARLRDS